MTQPLNQFLGNCVSPPIDGITYCRKRGQFMRRIQQHGFDYHSLFEHYNDPSFIPAELIASKENLQMLTWRENNCKGKKYDPMTQKVEQLLEGSVQ